MKFTRYQYNSLIAVICAMILALMIMAFWYAYEIGIAVVADNEESETRNVEGAEVTSITVETMPLTAADIESQEGSAEVESLEGEIETESETAVGAPSAEKMKYEAVENDAEEFPWYTSDYELLARLVWAEARGESFEGQLAVVEVVFNRVASPSFPYNIYDVIYEPGRFTTAASLENVTPTQMQYDVVTAALKGERVLNNPKCVFFSAGSSCGTYYTTIGNHVFGVEQ